MEYFVLEIITNTATFRNPDFQNFHKTLNLPPPPTLIGFAGAALGLSPKATTTLSILAFTEDHLEKQKTHGNIQTKPEEWNCIIIIPIISGV